MGEAAFNVALRRGRSERAIAGRSVATAPWSNLQGDLQQAQAERPVGLEGAPEAVAQQRARATEAEASLPAADRPATVRQAGATPWERRPSEGDQWG